MSFNQDAGTSVFREFVLYQDYHGLPTFKKVTLKDCKPRIISFLDSLKDCKPRNYKFE
jgi:hypothetical protein